MKKILLLTLCTVLTVLLLSSCGAKNQTNQRAQNNAPASDTVQNPDAVDTSRFIGEQRAREIALERADISGDDIIFDRVELDFDNGVWEYEVEFRQGRTEYDANIKADDGTVIYFETDFED